MPETRTDLIARPLGSANATGTRVERAIDRLMEVLVAVAGTESWQN